LGDASDGSLRCAAGLVGRHTGCSILFNELIQVEAKFGFQLQLDMRAAQQRSKAQAGFVEQAHG
jgi:hypothetical protein